MTALGRRDPAEPEPDEGPAGARRRRTRGELPSADPAWRLQRAIELAVAHLARRDRTTAQVRAHLVRRGIDDATADAALAELQETGTLDDAAYAARYAEDRRALDGWGSERIARHLRAAGVAQADADAALAAQDGEAELEAAVGVLRRRLGDPPEDDRGRERALGMLVRRGYELELAYDAVRAFARDAA